MAFSSCRRIGSGDCEMWIKAAPFGCPLPDKSWLVSWQLVRAAQNVSIWRRRLRCRMLRTCMTNTLSCGCALVEGKSVGGACFLSFVGQKRNLRHVKSNLFQHSYCQVKCRGPQSFTIVQEHTPFRDDPILRNPLIFKILILSHYSYYAISGCMETLQWNYLCFNPEARTHTPTDAN